MEACVVLMPACSSVFLRSDACFSDIEDAAETMDASLDACLVFEISLATLSEELSDDIIDFEIDASVKLTGLNKPSSTIPAAAAAIH
jgi:hypothetical protein